MPIPTRRLTAASLGRAHHALLLAASAASLAGLTALP